MDDIEIKRVEKIFFSIIILITLIILILPSVNSINFLELIKGLGKITGMGSSQTATFAITVNSNAPNITNVTCPTPDWSINEGGMSSVYFSFLAYDPEGVSNLNDTSAIATVNATISGTSTSRSHTDLNSSCSYVSDIGTSANYTCNITLWYWDMNGTWSINASVCDNNQVCTQNFTMNFSLGKTSAIGISPTSISFGSPSMGESNTTASDDPITINNTGNNNVSMAAVRMKAITLAGTDTKTIGAGNFTSGTETGSNLECDFSTTATKLVNNTATGITSAGLERGNSSIGTTTATEKLYYCMFPAVPTYLTPQTYDTTAGGSWTVDIV